MARGLVAQQATRLTSPTIAPDRKSDFFNRPVSVDDIAEGANAAAENKNAPPDQRVGRGLLRYELRGRRASGPAKLLPQGGEA